MLDNVLKVLVVLLFAISALLFHTHFVRWVPSGQTQQRPIIEFWEFANNSGESAASGQRNRVAMYVRRRYGAPTAVVGGVLAPVLLIGLAAFIVLRRRNGDDVREDPLLAATPPPVLSVQPGAIVDKPRADARPPQSRSIAAPDLNPEKKVAVREPEPKPTEDVDQNIAAKTSEPPDTLKIIRDRLAASRDYHDAHDAQVEPLVPTRRNSEVLIPTADAVAASMTAANSQSGAEATIPTDPTPTPLHVGQPGPKLVSTNELNQPALNTGAAAAPKLYQEWSDPVQSSEPVARDAAVNGAPSTRAETKLTAEAPTLASQEVAAKAVDDVIEPTALTTIDEAEEEDDFELPQFRLLASDMSMASARRIDSSTAAAISVLREAFTPTQPKRAARLFAGRHRQLKRIVSAIEEERAHVVIFGERGFGKTSLANIVSEIAQAGAIKVLSCSCSSNISFEEMFQNFLSEIALPLRGIPGGAHYIQNPDANGFAKLLPAGRFGATELTDALRHLTEMHVILLIDEFDRVRDDELKNQLAEAIKNLSDVSAQVTLLVLGVAENLEELLGKHPSIQRHVVGVHLPLMTSRELLRLVRAGEEAANVDFSDELCRVIVSLSRGLPYYAQLICLHSGRVAIERASAVVDRKDVVTALQRIADESDPIVVDVYDRATAGSNDVQKDVVFAAAQCDCDDYGTFTATDAVEVNLGKDRSPLHLLTVQRSLAALTKEKSGPMLKKINAPRGTRYSFVNSMMRQYVLVRQAEDRGLV